MLQNVINIEIEKLKQRGFDAVVSEQIVDVSTTIYTEYISNCIYILTGVFFSNYSAPDFTSTKISLYSPISCLNETQHVVASLSDGIFVKFKDFITFKFRTNENIDLNDIPMPVIKFKFVKITPYKIN
jgi:hypothetical protein